MESHVAFQSAAKRSRPGRMGSPDVCLNSKGLQSLMFVLGVMMAMPVQAQLRVTAIDWVQGRPEIPHPALNGKSTILQAVAEGGNCGGNYQYRWDYNGDGDYADAGEQWRGTSAGGHRSGYYAPLGLEVQYPDQLGDRLFFPKVEVDCAGERRSTTMPVLVRVDRICDGYPENIDGRCDDGDNILLTRQTHHDRVVDRSLWWMFNRISHYDDDGRRGGIHSCVFWGAPTYYGQGHMLNAFLRRSHGFGSGRETDPYYRHVTQCGLNALVGTYNMVGGNWFDDDGTRGWDGWRMQYTDGRLGGGSHWSSYASTAWVEPLANYGNAEYRTPGGENNVRGRELQDLAGDLADGLVYCMADSGQWYYSCRSDGHADASTNGWAPEALRLLERKFGTNTYGWAKDRQRNWLNAHCSGNSNDDYRLFGCNYHTENVGGGYGKLAGNALVGYGWTQEQDFNNHRGDTGWRMHGHWVAASRLNHNWWGLYFMYATTKGMRSFVPERREFENGRDWATEFAHFLLNISENDQFWRWCTDEGGAGECYWHWKASINRDTSTALSTQIVQTWLETQALARATPQETGPGIDITFDHSWSHILDPAVTLTRFRWNVRNQPEDDENGDGVIDVDEIQWDFETNDPNEAFRYQYNEALGWDDVRRFKVTLEVTDSFGRTNYDDKSVQITLSLKNHPPVIIGHPEGLNSYYTGYVGAAINLDPRATNDVDADHEVFPGDDDKPRGIPDRITSICYDIDLDDNWCEAGEDATNGPISFIPQAGMQVGDKIAIPIRACDEGRWNGKCYQPGDGGPAHLTHADCSDCAFGSVGLELVHNREPPTIESAQQIYEVEPAEQIQLDFSDSVDPEGVLGDGSAHNGVRFTYRLPDGGGRIEPTPGYADPDDFGPRPTFIPDGDGNLDVRLIVRAMDFAGSASEADFTVRVANAPPTLDDWNPRFTPRPPVVSEQPIIENLGGRRYRLTVDAMPDPGWDAYIDYSTTEPFNEPVTVTVDMDGDAVTDLTTQVPDGSLGPFTFSVGGVHRVMTVNVSDGEDSDIQQRNVEIPPIPENVRQDMRFSVDIGGDGSLELANSNRSTMEFFAPQGTSEIRVTGLVSGNGFRVPFDAGDVRLPNNAPSIQSVRVADQDGYNVVLVSNAFDTDNDPITYTINWGDGTPPQPTRAVISTHSYPRGRYEAYQVTVTAEDVRGGRAEHRLTITIEEPQIIKADIGSLTWRKITPTEGRYDGVRSLAITPAGRVFIHNYVDEIRRLRDDGQTWDTVLEDVECCGAMVARGPGEIILASPDGLYYTNDDGDTWALWAEQKFTNVALSPNGDFVVASTHDEIFRYDFTGGLADRFDVSAPVHDIETCSTGSRSAFSTTRGLLMVNDDADLAAGQWRVPEARFSKGQGQSSVSFDDECNLYQGMWNGYRVWTYPDGPALPASTKSPNHLIHPSGSHGHHIHRGTANINDILAWPGGPFIVATARGIYASEQHHNATSTPYWKGHNGGITRSTIGRKLALSPTSGYAYLATSAATQVPKYCRKAKNTRRRSFRFRRRRTGRQQQYIYVFCGYTFHYYGGLYRSSTPLVNMKVIGSGGSAFKTLNTRGTVYSDDADGLVVDIREQSDAPLWLPDTANSTLVRWDTTGPDPRAVGTYRVGLPAGECPDTCCWNDGCNMASRVAVDDAGDAYVATIGFGMQGTVTKVAGNIGQCIDRNGNDQIETSTSDVALDYGDDECIIWSVPVGGENALLRSMVIDQGDDQRPDGYIWVGAYNESRLYKLDPNDGQTMSTIDLGLAPFGAVIDGGGRVWATSLGDASIQAVDTENGAVGPLVQNPQDLRNGCRNSYGSTIDHYGRIWLAGWECNDAVAYDPRTDSWCRVAMPRNRTGGRGITVDHNNRIYTALGGDGPSGIAWWEADDCVADDTFNAIHYRNTAPNTIGASSIDIDRLGRVWLAHSISTSLFRLSTLAGVTTRQWDNAKRVYSFADSTGLERKNSLGVGTYTEDIEADCDDPTWSQLVWTAEVPNGADISFTARTANQRNKLSQGASVLIGQLADDGGPNQIGDALDDQGVVSRRFLRVQAKLKRSNDGTSPVLRRFSVLWSCD